MGRALVGGGGVPAVTGRAPGRGEAVARGESPHPCLVAGHATLSVYQGALATGFTACKPQGWDQQHARPKEK
jgi:hypothetical protein